MAKLVSMVVMVAANKVADVLELLGDVADTVTMQTTASAERADVDDADDEEPIVPRRRDVRTVAARPAAMAQRGRTRIAGKVIYTPVGTARQITKMLDELRGVTSMRAMVLRDLAKHPGSSNREVRERIAAKAKAAGLSVESVDNVIWQLVNKRVIGKEAAAE